MSDESIFAAALQKPPGPERQAYLDAACGADANLRGQVERLLAADDRTAGILERGPDVAPTGAPPPAPPLAADRPFAGRFKLRQKLGEGGMGEVWVADQAEPVQRRVAIKVVRPGLDSDRMLARFDQERQALALMDHPNIARVLDAGVADGRPYFVMELIKGVPITQYCDEAKLSPRQRLELFVPVCQAVQHAHQKGIIHRDLKPSNVLVALYDGKPVPKVIDFGIAKATGPRLTDQSVYTEVGSVLGTIEYMSPEQAELNNLDIDTRSDVYALGVLLYELLTGTVPFSRKELTGAAFLEMLRVIKEVEPPRPSTRLSGSGTLPSVSAVRQSDPRRLVALVRGELDWIVMKALEKDRARRYETANGFAADVLRYLSGEAVQAHPPSAAYRLKKFAHKHKGPLVAAAVVLLALVAGVVGTSVGLVEAKRQAGVAEARKRDAEARGEELTAANGSLRQAGYIADVNLARVAWDENNIGLCRDLLDKHRPAAGEADLRGFEWHYLNRLARGDQLTVRAHGGRVSTVAFLPDGKRLITSGASQSLGGNEDPRDLPGEVKLWDAATGRPLALRLDGPADKVKVAVLSPDGTHLAASCGNHTIVVWNLATGEYFTLEGPAGRQAGGAAFSPDGKRLVSVHLPANAAEMFTDEPRSTVRVWDLATRTPVMSLDHLPSIFTRPAFSPDGKRLAAAVRYQGVVRVWSVDTGTEAYSCKYAGKYPYQPVFSPDGKQLVACGDNGIQVWDTDTHQSVATWRSESRAVIVLAFSPDGKRLAMAGIDGVVEVWATATGLKLHTFKGHTGAISGVAFSPDGNRLTSAGYDGTWRVWDTTESLAAGSIPKPATDSEEAQFSPDGRTLLTGVNQGIGKSVRLWDVTTGKPRGDAIEFAQTANSQAWTADGKSLYVSDEGKTVTVIDVASGTVVRRFPVDAGAKEYRIALSPDGRWCAYPGPDKTVRVQDTRTPTELRTIKGLDATVHTLLFSPDGSRLFGVDDGGTARLWDATTGRELGATRLSDTYVFRARFSADGKRVALVGNVSELLTGNVRVLDGETAREVGSLKGHTLNVLDAVFSPDGRRLATTSADRTVRVWDLATGREVLKLGGATDAQFISSIRFVQGGRQLVGVTNDRVIRVWDATPLPDKRTTDRRDR